MSGWRQARAIVLLPGTVVVVVPALILIAAGFAFWLWTVRLFSWIPRRTPWSPPG